tara:strand:- start:774 stop:1907 length:1134 start_codon:yes stop_codon:yes gene_type:complete
MDPHELMDFEPCQAGITAEALLDILDAVPSGILVLDLLGQPRFANYLGRLLLREGVDPPVDGDLKRLCRPDLFEVVNGVFQDVRRVGFCSPRPFELYGGGGPIEVGLLGSLLRSSGGRPSGVVLIVEDQTARSALREAEAKQQRTSASLHVAAHELRGPLTGVLGYAELLQMMAPENLVERVDKLYREASRIRDMITDMLDADRVADGQTDLDLKEIDLNELLTDLYERTKVSSPDHEVVKQIDPKLSTIKADAGALERVFHNLLNNAVKYSPPGSRIELHAEVTRTSVEVRVVDSGPGIDPEDLAHVFEPFYRPSGSRSSVAGSGIGLALVKTLVESHGGSVKLTSEAGQGSTFRVRLPLRAVQSQRLSIQRARIP